MVVSSIVNGQKLVPGDATGEWSTVTGLKCVYSYRQIDEVMDAAKAAFLKVRELEPTQRSALVKKVHTGLLQSKAVILDSLRNEMGRKDEDLELEWNQTERLLKGLNFGHPETAEEGRGVSAVVCSYVWPVFYAVQFVVMNLLSGNVSVLKPSEKSTASVFILIHALSSDPELAPWIHLLVGEKETGRRLVCHEKVNTVLFMGSFEVGMRVKQDTLSQSWKQVLLYLGAKNPAILCEDYPESAMKTLLQDSFLMTGQHCRSVSLIFVHESKLDSFQKVFHDEAKKVQMGPLIDESMLERYLKFSGISEREGAQVIMRGKPLGAGPQKKGAFVAPTLSLFTHPTADLVKKSVTLETEILSPHVSILGFSSYDQLLELCDSLQWGLVASVWTEQKSRFESLARSLAFGEVLWNQSLLEWDPLESYQARKKSGNSAISGPKLIGQLTHLKAFK